MQLDLLNLLQTLLAPLAVGAVVVAAVLVHRLRRRPARPAAPRAARPATPPTTLPTTPRATPQASARPSPEAAAQPAPRAGTGALLPPARPIPPAPAAPAPALPLRADLLLVDDSAVVRAKLRRLFEPAGYRIALAHDGEAALALLHQGRYKLLITDLEMPRLDGLGLVRAAQALPACAGMAMLAITGHEDLQAQLGQLQAVAGIHRKPWVDDDLLGQVQALVAPSLQPAEPALQA